MKDLIFRSQHQRASATFSSPRLSHRKLPVPENLPMERNLFTIAEAEQRRWRVINRKVAGPESTLIVQVARSLENYDHEIGELLAVLFVTGPLALVTALSGGYFLARRALAPVDRMTDVAQRSRRNGSIGGSRSRARVTKWGGLPRRSTA